MKVHKTLGVVALALALASSGSEAAVYPLAVSRNDTGDLVTQAQWPGWRGGWRGPPGWYGTIVAGVALGALITVAAIGAVPPRPAPNLCWYWADPYRNRGYWDYCY
jgi:hypothetical protein